MPIPSVKIYIRHHSTRTYERLRTRNPQSLQPGDVYCLHVWYDGKRKWITVGTNIKVALRREMEEQTRILNGKVETPAPAKTKPTLAHQQAAFLEYKRTTTKKDGTPLD